MRPKLFEEFLAALIEISITPKILQTAFNMRIALNIKKYIIPVMGRQNRQAALRAVLMRQNNVIRLFFISGRYL